MKSSTRRIVTSALRRRVAISSLQPVHSLEKIADAAPGSEPPREEIHKSLKSGNQPYPVVVCGTKVLYGLELLAVAKAMGWLEIEVEEFSASSGLHEGQLLIMAAGLHIRGVEQRVRPAPFELRRLKRCLYQVWSQNFKRRCPRSKRNPQVGKEFQTLRQRLIKEAFGLSQRSLERDGALEFLRPELVEAVRERRLPLRVVEIVCRLSMSDQISLSQRLAVGIPFKEVCEEFTGLAYRSKKTNRAAAHAFRVKLHGLLAEVADRKDFFPLTTADYPAAREVVGLLGRWLAAAPPVDTDGKSLQDECRELQQLQALRRRETIATCGSGHVRGGRKND